MNSFQCWQRWLVISCFLFASVGILVATALDSLPFLLWNAELREVFAGGGALAPETESVKTFLLGPLGGTILDSTISAQHGAYLGIDMINMVTLVGQGLPLAFTAPRYVREESDEPVGRLARVAQCLALDPLVA